MKNNLVVTILIVVLVGAGAFFAGMKYQEGKVGGMNNTRQLQGMGNGSRGAGQNGQGRLGAGRPVNGEILEADDKSITVKLADGSSKIILLGDKTVVNKTSEASKTDLKTGIKVAAFGTENSDGSITANNIQINPVFNRTLGIQSPNQGQKSPDAKEIIVEGSNYKFAPDKITVKKGEKTRIVFKNTGGVHDFRVDELNIATAVIQGDKEDFVEFTADKTGEFEFYCSVDGHRQMGMKGTMTVE